MEPRYRNTSKKLKTLAVFVLIIGIIILFNSNLYGALLNKKESSNYNIQDLNTPKLSSNPELIWQKTWGYGTREWSPCIALDNESNIILVGNLDWFDDIFIAKYNPNGNQLWNKTWDKNSHDEPLSVVVDTENNIYVAGRTGTYGATNKVMLLIKFNSTGDEIWHREWTGSNDIGARGIALDSDEHVYVIGRPDSGDIFIRKYMPNGDLNWSRTWGGTGGGYEVWYGVYGIEIDNENNIYITGRSDTLGAGGQDMIFLNYNTTGDLQWAKTWGYSGDERGYDILKDSENHLYVSSFSSTTNELFLIKYYSSGNQIWNKSLGNFDIEGCFKMDIDVNDKIHCVGTRQTNNDDISVLVLSKFGDILEEINWSSSDMDRGYDIALNENNEIYVTGYTTNIGAGQEDIILLKYSNESPHFWVLPPFVIDDNGGGDFTWAEAALEEWCSGSGTWNDPYAIQNVAVNGRITVRDSNAYFKFYNCSAGFDLQNVWNGKLINNYGDGVGGNGIYLGYSYNNSIIGNSENANNRGIMLDHSNNNTLINNTANNNWVGFNLDRSHNNSLIMNTANYNDYGYSIHCSKNNTIRENLCYSNNQDGIKIDHWTSEFSAYNMVLKNNISANLGNGILITSPCIENLIYYNYIINNNIQAQDDGSNNQWDNGTIGNYWSDYGGVDGNGDGIGDTPYNITGSAGSFDLYPIWGEVDDTPPLVTINLPLTGQFFGAIAPGFNASIYDINLDTIWYTTDGGLNNYTCAAGGYINQSVWDLRPEGPVILRIYANDISGNTNYDEVAIFKDSILPVITIHNPQLNEFYRFNTPEYNVSVFDANLDKMWYSLDGSNLTKEFLPLTDFIDQALWDQVENGSVLIKFYANDTTGNIGFSEVIVIKDILAPMITIESPSMFAMFGEVPPDFRINLTEGNLEQLWYRLNNGTIITANTTFVSLNGSIEQIIWDQVGNGTVAIEFFASDTLGNYGSATVTVRKQLLLPIIIINTPVMDDAYGFEGPVFTISVGGSELDSRWYTVDGGTTNYTFTGLSSNITNMAWDPLPDGTVVLRVYLRDLLGNEVFDEISIIKDTEAPSLSIISPSMGAVFGINSPSFVVEFGDNHMVDTLWYSFGSGNDTTYFIFTNNGTIDQDAWDTFANETISIRFYVNDSVGNLNSQEVILRKDIIAPSITILEPEMNEIFGRFAPSFMITVNDVNFHQVWYSLNGLYDISITDFTGALSQSVWESLPDGPITLRFSANDTAGNSASRNVVIYKDVGEPIPTPPDMVLLFIVIGVVAGIAGASLAAVIFIRNRGKKPPKKKRTPKEIDGELFCPFCHSKVKVGQEFCDYCGNRLHK